MATSRGGSDVARFIAEQRRLIEEKLLRGAGRAGAKVLREEARHRLGGREAETGAGTKVLIADALKIVVRSKPGVITVKVILKGPGSYVGRWLEYGTAPHLISARADVREGRSINRINKLAREGSLSIGGKFVGASVWHKGADKKPFMRVSLDTREADARAEMQRYINSHVTRKGIVIGPEGDDE
jgi:hypothetical protein